jgi:hypothetical protein
MTTDQNSGYVSQLSDIPKVPHFALISADSVHVPGDERSRTNPGHGYPAHNVPTINYRWFLVREDWEAAIAKEHALVFSKKDFIAVAVTPATVTSTIQVKVDIK